MEAGKGEGRRRAEGKGKEGKEEEENLRPRSGTGMEKCGSQATFFFLFVPKTAISLSEVVEGAPMWFIWIRCTTLPSFLHPPDSGPSDIHSDEQTQHTCRGPHTAHVTP